MLSIHKDIIQFNHLLPENFKSIADRLAVIIQENLDDISQHKIWHGHPVWFINENPIVGYSLQKRGLRLMFWSGQSFDEPDLSIYGPTFKDASIFYSDISEINEQDLSRWLGKGRSIQWDYKNLIKRKGKLEKIENTK